MEKLRQRWMVVYYTSSITSASALEKCSPRKSGSRPPVGAVFPLEMSYISMGCVEVSQRRAPGQPLLVLFLGSTIGNFEPEAAISIFFTAGSANASRRATHLLLGTDLVKPVPDLLAMTPIDADPVERHRSVPATRIFWRALIANWKPRLHDLRQFERPVRVTATTKTLCSGLRCTFGRASIQIVSDSQKPT